MRFAFLFCMLQTFVSAGSAQDTVVKTKYLLLNAGIQQTIESNLATVIHQGVVWKFGFGKERLARHLRSYNFHVGFARPKNQFEWNQESVYVQASANYDYAFKVYNNFKLACFAGPSIGINYNVSMYPNWDDSHAYWGNYASLGATARARYSTKQNAQLVAIVGLPLLSILSRPDLYRLQKIEDISFNGIVSNLHSNLQSGSWETLRYFNASIAYESRLTQKRRYAMGYNFNVTKMKHENSKPLRMLSHNLYFNRYFR